MTDLAEYFNDPLDPPRSLQLNNKFWPKDRYEHLDMLRAAEYDVENRRFVSLKKTLKPVAALLPSNYRRAFLSRLVYSMVYSVSFAPIRFSIKLSKEFVRMNAYGGQAAEAETKAQRTDEVKYIAELAHNIYRDHYGADLLTSTYAVRYMSSSNPNAAKRMTAHGDLSDFHLDGGKDFTCIIYLCPVSLDNGCFSYIDGSPAVRKSHVLRALHQVVDLDMAIASPDQRSHLPLEVRGSTSVGNYLDDSKTEPVRKACIDVVGNAGDGVLFNGFDTIHRGGQPLNGERTALFVSTRGHFNKRLKKAVYAQLAYLWW
jgi:hypothetical protein